MTNAETRRYMPGGPRWSRGRIRILAGVLTVVVIAGILAPEALAAARGFFAKLQVLSTIVRLSREVYVDEIDAEDLMEGAIDGLLDRLDPHSNYLPADEASRLTERIQGSFGGVGIRYSMINSIPTVISTIEDGPAERSGVLSGDRIVKVNSRTTLGWRTADVQEHLRGTKGSSVRISVSRAGAPKPIDINIVRGDIPLKSVPYSFMLDDSTGYVRITNFAVTTGIETAEALVALRREGMRYLIVDLRNNGGGDMSAAVAVSNYFLPEGTTIVSQRGRWGPANQTFYATAGPLKLDIPVVIILNRGSASASEIVAGALQDTDRGLILGQRSFGKGLVQRSFDLGERTDEGGILLLTVARYYTPTGRLIQRDYTTGTAQYLVDGMSADAPLDTAGLKAYSTPLGRIVYGGGGIYPDHVIQREQIDRTIYGITSQSLFFRFSNELAGHGEQYPDTFDEYTDMEVGDELWNNFVSFATSVDSSLTQEILLGLRLEISPYILAGIAGRFDSSQSRYRLLSMTDTELAAARIHLLDARKLLTASADLGE
jgi:carboxyl-terminal processing protease